MPIGTDVQFPLERTGKTVRIQFLSQDSQKNERSYSGLNHRLDRILDRFHNLVRQGYGDLGYNTRDAHLQRAGSCATYG